VVGWVPEGLGAAGATVRSGLRDGLGLGGGLWEFRARTEGEGAGAVPGTVSTGTGAAVTTTVQLFVSMGLTLRMSGIKHGSDGQTWKEIV
jgi:hypothetical protein